MQAGIPLELVKYNPDDGKFIVGKQALEVLRQVSEPREANRGGARPLAFRSPPATRDHA